MELPTCGNSLSSSLHRRQEQWRRTVWHPNAYFGVHDCRTVRGHIRASETIVKRPSDHEYWYFQWMAIESSQINHPTICFDGSPLYFVRKHPSSPIWLWILAILQEVFRKKLNMIGDCHLNPKHRRRNQSQQQWAMPRLPVTEACTTSQTSRLGLVLIFPPCWAGNALSVAYGVKKNQV